MKLLAEISIVNVVSMLYIVSGDIKHKAFTPQCQMALIRLILGNLTRIQLR